MDQTEAEADGSGSHPQATMTIKAMGDARRATIIEAARRSSQTVSDYVYEAVQRRIRHDREPLEVRPRANGPILDDAPDDRPRSYPAAMEMAALLDAMTRFVTAEPAKGNAAFAAEVRNFLRQRLMAPQLASVLQHQDREQGERRAE